MSHTHDANNTHVVRTTSDVSDVELLLGWANGCAQSGNLLIERHVESVHRFFRYKVTPRHLDDLVQQTFLAGLEGHVRYRGQVPFKHFLLGIARHQLFNFFRDKSRSDQSSVLPTSVRDHRTSPTGALSRDAEARALLDALTTLPLEQQMILELSYWENLSGPEIATVLELPLNTMYSQLRRAKLALRRAIDQRQPRLVSAGDSLVQLDAWAERLHNACR